MSVMQECPVCKSRKSLKNKKCKRCGENLEKARRSKRTKYYVHYKIEGKQHTESFGSLEDAKAADGKIKAMKKEGKILDILPDAKYTFQELSDWYLNLSPVQKLKSLKRVKGALKNFNKVFGNTCISDIKPFQLEEYQEKRLDEGKARATVDMEITIAQTVINKALDNEKITDESILRTFRKIKRKLKSKSNARDRILKTEEFEALMRHLPQHLKLIVATGYYTGMRLDEILSMTWDRVNLNERFFELFPENTKDGDYRKVPICNELHILLKGIPQSIHTEFLFLYKGSPIKDIRTGLSFSCKKAGIKYGRNVKGGFTFHDLRHTFNTNMRKAGVPESVIMEITGHSTRAMFDRYNTVDLEDLKDATKSMEKFLNDTESEDLDDIVKSYVKVT